MPACARNDVIQCGEIHGEWMPLAGPICSPENPPQKSPYITHSPIPFAFPGMGVATGRRGLRMGSDPSVVYCSAQCCGVSAA